MTEPLQPRRWVEFRLEPYPNTGITTYRWSTRSLAGTFFVEGRVPVDGFENITRRASDMSGDPNVDSATLIINDADGTVRDLLSAETTKWFKNREGTFKLLSAAAFAAGLTPRILFGGHCYDVQPADERKVEMQFEEPLAKYLDKTYPQYYLRDAYPYRFDAQGEVIDIDTDDPGMQIPTALRDQVMPVYYGPFIDSATDPVTGEQRAKGMCPTFFMGYTFLTAGGDLLTEPSPELAAILPGDDLTDWGGWGELFVCLGETDIPNVYASSLTETPYRIRYASDRYGVDIIAPGHTGWPFGTNYVMRNGFKVTVIYARGPALWHHITGLVNITVDLCGWKNNDGDAIDQAAFGLQSFITEHVLAHDGVGFTSGPEIGLPLYADGRSMIWTDKVQAWQDASAARLGNTKGYLISMALTKPITLREIRQKWNITFDSFQANNAAGQMYPFLIDDLALPTAGVAVRQFLEIRGNLPAPHIGWDEIENWMDYTVGYDPEQDTPRTITINIKNDESIAALKEKRSINEIRDLAYTADDATANDVMGRRLTRLSEPPIYQAFPVATAGVDREIGEQIRGTHRDGLALSNSPCIILGHVTTPEGITLETLDITRILASAIGGAVEDGGDGWGWELWP